MSNTVHLFRNWLEPSLCGLPYSGNQFEYHASLNPKRVTCAVCIDNMTPTEANLYLAYRLERQESPALTESELLQLNWERAVPHVP